MIDEYPYRNLNEPGKPVWDEPDDPCPNCGAQVRGKELYEGGGVECSERCGY